MCLRDENKNAENNEEKRLIFRIKQNDHRAFEEIVKIYQKKIFKLAYSFFHDKDDAMEIVQETFLKLYKKIHQFREDLHFQNWIYKIASNLCIDHYRRFKKKKVDEREFYNFLKNHQAEKNPEEVVSNEMEKQRIRHYIQFLPKRQKMVFILKHFSHLKFREISTTLNISIGTAKSIHHRAISHLKQQCSVPRRGYNE